MTYGKVFWPLNETNSRLTLLVRIFYLLWNQKSFFVIKKQCILHDRKRRKKLKTKWRLEVPKHVHAKKHSYGVLYQCMPSSISRKCLLDGQTLAKT